MESGLVIERDYKDLQTEGNGRLIKDGKTIFKFCSLELPWKDNQKNISCIPQGKYKGVKHISPTFGNSIWIQDVPNRSEILIHVGNFIGSNIKARQDPESDGCPFVGKEFVDISGYGINDLSQSRKTIDEIYELCDDEIDIIITEQSDTGML